MEEAPGGDPLRKLVARQMYGNFNKGPQCSDRGSSPQRTVRELKKILDKYPSTAQYTDNIVRNWCNVGLTAGTDGTEGFLCPFFYYWLGDIIYNDLTEKSSFKEVMSTIYGTLGTYITPCNYNDAYRSTSEHNFKQRKTVFDYYHDYQTIRKDLNDYRFDCKEKYAKYLDSVSEDYEKVKASCLRGSGSHGDQYCTHINTIFTDDNSPTALKSECEEINEKDFNLIKENKPHDQEGKVGRTHSFFYREFNGAGSLSIHPSVKAIQNELNRHHEVDSEKDKIQDAWCLVANKGAEEKKDPSYCQYCNFLYFWIGDKIWTALKGETHHTTFKNIMSLVCGKLMDLVNGGGGGCKMECMGSDTPIDRTTFLRKKEEYTNTQDQANESKRRLTTQPQHLSLDEAGQALALPGGTFPLCSSGHATSESDLTCVPNPQFTDSSSTITTSGTNTTPIVSSAAALLGIPMATFFLYKYNLLPSWLHNKLGGGNRRGRRWRSTGPNFDDDTLTAEYSTDTSTTAHLSTTTDGASTLYDRGRLPTSRGRGRANNKNQRRKNISYQNM